MKIFKALAMVSGVVLAIQGSPLLQAQDLAFGGKFTVSDPMGDFGDSGFLNNRLGYGVGLQLAIPVPGGALVPRADYTAYKNSGNYDARAQMLQVGVDYDYYFNHQGFAGPYVGAGLGYGSTEFKQNTVPNGLDDSPNNIFYAGQLGFMFTHNLGVELRYTYAEYKTHFSGLAVFWSIQAIGSERGRVGRGGCRGGGDSGRWNSLSAPKLFLGSPAAIPPASGDAQGSAFLSEPA
ncbi:MAG: outer membrane beta-barrel protein [Holophaga sp.]